MNLTPQGLLLGRRGQMNDARRNVLLNPLRIVIRRCSILHLNGRRSRSSRWPAIARTYLIDDRHHQQLKAIVADEADAVEQAQIGDRSQDAIE